MNKKIVLLLCFISSNIQSTFSGKALEKISPFIASRMSRAIGGSTNLADQIRNSTEKNPRKRIVQIQAGVEKSNMQATQFSNTIHDIMALLSSAECALQESKQRINSGFYLLKKGSTGSNKEPNDLEKSLAFEIDLRDHIINKATEVSLKLIEQTHHEDRSNHAQSASSNNKKNRSKKK